MRKESFRELPPAFRDSYCVKEVIKLPSTGLDIKHKVPVFLSWSEYYTSVIKQLPSVPLSQRLILCGRTANAPK